MDLTKVTLEDCMEMKARKNKAAVIENGSLIKFVEESEETC
ncbi:MAG: hypothetical protein U0J62_09655 [Lachnospiraceae bacterium]|nr:hypothetical protein [Lachnospiraceae bacterium]